mgnify:CR=1 FL=1
MPLFLALLYSFALLFSSNFLLTSFIALRYSNASSSVLKDLYTLGYPNTSSLHSLQVLTILFLTSLPSLIA